MRRHLIVLATLLRSSMPSALSKRTVGVVYSVILNPLVVELASQGRTATVTSGGVCFAAMEWICSRRVAEDGTNV